MNFSRQVREAFFNLTSSKLRSLLAILGILMGTGSVVAMVSSGLLAKQESLAHFKNLGTNLSAISVNDTKHVSADTVDSFTLEVAMNLAQASPAIEKVAPFTTGYSPIIYESHKISGEIIGSVETLQELARIKVADGRFVSHLDKYNHYAVVGHKLAEQMKTMKVGPILGSQIKLGKYIFTIVGILQPWESNAFFYQDLNRGVIVPLEASRLLSKYAKIRNVVIELKEESDLNAVDTNIKAYFKEHTQNKRIYIRNAKQLIENMKSQANIFTIMLGLIGSISLLVGGIGVMNVMLVSVIERHREIGIRRAIGAKRRDIQLLFLIEAVTLSVSGGAVGVLVGVGVSYGIAQYSHWAFTLFWMPIAIGFIVSVLTGIFFGFYPAHRAAKLDPIQTLRSD